jgi:hypothetical protein
MRWGASPTETLETESEDNAWQWGKKIKGELKATSPPRNLLRLREWGPQKEWEKDRTIMAVLF